MNAWTYLGFAIALEIAGTFLLKLSHGFERWHWVRFPSPVTACASS
jgi:small multidrug resistance pump